MREIKWSTNVHHLEGERRELELDASLNWEPVQLWSVSTEDKCDGFCITTLAAAFWALCKRAMFLDCEPYKTELT